MSNAKKNYHTLIIKDAQKLQNFNYQIQRTITNIYLSRTKNNIETLVMKYNKELRSFNFEVQTAITKL